MLNATYADEAAKAFNETPAEGPYTLAMSNSAIWVPLPNISITYPTILDQIHQLASNDTTPPASLHLPPAYNLDPTLTAGYRAQLRGIAALLANPHAPSLESGFATGTSAAAILLHPLSRGTARLNLTAPFEPPVLDYRAGSNPVDLALHVAHTRYLRRMVQTKKMRALGAVETQPGLGRETDEEILACEFCRFWLLCSPCHVNLVVLLR
jgi:hypothetical protein